MRYVYTLLLSVYCNIASAQQVGSKISFLDADGKTQTGVIKSIWFKHFKVTSDRNQSELWLNPDQITLLKSDSISTPADVTTINVPVKNKADVKGSTDAVLHTVIQPLPSTIKEEKPNNVMVPKVWVLGADGKTYTGTIIDSSIDNYKVKYDGSDDEAWADKSVFNFVNTSIKTPVKEAAKKILRKGDKVEFDLYSDGSKWVSGTILEVIEGKPSVCLTYKIRYVYDASHIYSFHRDCKYVRSMRTKFDKIKNDMEDSTTQTIVRTPIDSSITGDYACFQAVWDYNTKTNSWEPHGIVKLSEDGTFKIVNEGVNGRYEWDAFKNEIRFHDGLEGATAVPSVKTKNTEIKLLFETQPAKIWSCRTHRN